MAHYDFEYDGGKGLQNSMGWQKSKIQEFASNPVDKNKMRSFSFTKANRDEKRGVFDSMMSMKPMPVRIQHPKF
jgi:hypothetical protein